jgi:hypothetical protein
MKPIEIEEQSIEEFKRKIDQWANCGDPFIALQARAVRHLHPALVQWMKEEAGRDTSPREVFEASGHILLNFVLMLGEAIAPSSEQPTITRGIMSQAYRSFISWTKLHFASYKQ